MGEYQDHHEEKCYLKGQACQEKKERKEKEKEKEKKKRKRQNKKKPYHVEYAEIITECD